MLPKILSLVSIILMLAWMLYLLLGSMPLLILKHDDESDSRLVRGMFDVHYRILMTIASVGALSSALVDRWPLAVAFASVVLIGFTARAIIVGRMDGLRPTLKAAGAPAVRMFRRLHVSGLVLDVAMIVCFIGVLATMSSSIVNCIQVPPGCVGDACRVQCSLLS